MYSTNIFNITVSAFKQARYIACIQIYTNNDILCSNILRELHSVRCRF